MPGFLFDWTPLQDQAYLRTAAIQDENKKITKPLFYIPQFLSHHFQLSVLRVKYKIFHLLKFKFNVLIYEN